VEEEDVALAEDAAGGGEAVFMDIQHTAEPIIHLMPRLIHLTEQPILSPHLKRKRDCFRKNWLIWKRR
jgi:hypothetical protein